MAERYAVISDFWFLIITWKQSELCTFGNKHKDLFMLQMFNCVQFTYPPAINRFLRSNDFLSISICLKWSHKLSLRVNNFLILIIITTLKWFNPIMVELFWICFVEYDRFDLFSKPHRENVNILTNQLNKHLFGMFKCCCTDFCCCSRKTTDWIVCQSCNSKCRMFSGAHERDTER